MRYERKYRVESINPQLVEQVVRMHPASFRKAYPDRKVNNIYFDTASFSTFYENQSGIANRQKHRVRWYGEFMQIIQNPILETKVKENFLGYKKSQPLPHMALSEMDQIKKLVNQNLEDTNELEPVLINAYRRSYWVTPNQLIRLTVDWEMQFHQWFKQPRFSQYQLQDTAVVVELKYPKNQEAVASHIMQYLPFRITKNSKYVTGMSLLT